jgi:hypothetical protein
MPQTRRKKQAGNAADRAEAGEEQGRPSGDQARKERAARERRPLRQGHPPRQLAQASEVTRQDDLTPANMFAVRPVTHVGGSEAPATPINS